MNYFPWHIGDYAAHTGHLEPMEDLIYRRLLDAYYLREGALPADIQTTAKLVRLRSMASDVEAVLNEFFILTEEGWKHSRCDEEIAKMQDKQAKARDAAEQSVKSRKAAAERRLAEQQTSVERTLASIQTNVELPTPTPTPTPTPVLAFVGKPTLPCRFLEFWNAWPTSVRKVAKAECEKRWKARGLDAHADAIVASVMACRGTKQWQEGFEPAPLTYLNQKRWEDGGENANPGFARDWNTV